MKEPIAIIGMSCRFPGGINNIDTFWNFIKEGKDAIECIPETRWDIDSLYDVELGPDTMCTREGGMLHNIEFFDSNFFGLSAHEARSMDPQQRLLLEIAWETFENAGFCARKVEDSSTGVFVGFFNMDYQRMLKNAPARGCTSVSSSILANRISYTFNLKGPSISLDTACSSSLVAIDLACQNLYLENCEMALVGGVNMILTPEWTIAFSQAGMLSPDGRSKAFSDKANGYVRSEGCGMVLLKPLHQAIADGNSIHAVICGTAVNHNGRTELITTPDTKAQKSVIEKAIRRANIAPQQVGFVEAHGTGTILGDVAEFHALKDIYGKDRDSPCFLGSVKTNIGHLEAAAGIAGLIKVVLCIKNQKIPGNLHLQKINENISHEKQMGKIEIPCKTTDWSCADLRYAAVSSFGFGGTNAHLILRENAQSKEELSPRNVYAFSIAARNDETIHDLVVKCRDFLVSAPQSLADVCFSISSRSLFASRLSIVAKSLEDLQQQLTKYMDKQPEITTYCSEETNKKAQVVFMFGGQGTQYLEMAKLLYESEPIFRKNIQLCAVMLQEEFSLLDILYNTENPSFVDQTKYAQPAIFCVEYALAQMLISWNVKPDVVIGHSIGEYVAACISGVFSLEDALVLVAKRGTLMQSLPEIGSMYMIPADAATVEAIIQPYSEDICIAVENSSSNTIISGKNSTLEAILEKFEEEYLLPRKLTVSHAFHSPLMEPILKEFADFAKKISFSNPTIPIYSNVSGKLHTTFDADYWKEHLRQPVHFMTQIENLGADSYNIFVEIGVDTILSKFAQKTLKKCDCFTTSILDREENNWETLTHCLSKLYTKGVDVNWKQFYGQRNIVFLPHYPFQRKRFWLSEDEIKSYSKKENQ